MIHTTIGIYSNGDYKVNGVKSENLAAHIAYNVRNRFGRALVVDGVCIYEGYYEIKDREKLEEIAKDIKREKDTAPYV